MQSFPKIVSRTKSTAVLLLSASSPFASPYARLRATWISWMSLMMQSGLSMRFVRQRRSSALASSLRGVSAPTTPWISYSYHLRRLVSELRRGRRMGSTTVEIMSCSPSLSAIDTAGNSSSLQYFDEKQEENSLTLYLHVYQCAYHAIFTIGALEGLSSGKAPSTLCCVYCPDASNSSYDVRHQMCMGRLISLPSSDSRGYPWTSCLQYYWRNNARRGKSCTPHQEDSSQSRSAAAASTVRVSIKEYDSERYCIKF